MLKDFKKLAKKRPLTAGVVGVSAVYSVYTLYRATQAGKDQFWAWDTVDGIGASTSTTSSTSSSHAMMSRGTSGDLMKHPSALFGYKDLSGHCTGMGAHCTARGNPHCHCGGGVGAGHKGRMKTMYGHKESLGYGEDAHTSPSQLFGVPNKIKRRVMMNEMNEGFNGYNNPHESDIYSHAQPQQMSAEEAEIIAGAGGWL